MEVTIKGISHLGCSFLEGTHSHSFPSLPADPCLLACEVPTHSVQVLFCIRSQCTERHKNLQQKHCHRENMAVETLVSSSGACMKILS